MHLKTLVPGFLISKVFSETYKIIKYYNTIGIKMCKICIMYESVTTKIIMFVLVVIYFKEFMIIVIVSSKQMKRSLRQYIYLLYELMFS